MMKYTIVCLVLAVFGQSVEACVECRIAQNKNLLEIIANLPENVFKIVPNAYKRIDRPAGDYELTVAMAEAIDEIISGVDLNKFDRSDMTELYEKNVDKPCMVIVNLVEEHDLDKLPQTDERVKSMKNMAKMCKTFEEMPSYHLIEFWDNGYFLKN